MTDCQVFTDAASPFAALKCPFDVHASVTETWVRILLNLVRCLPNAQSNTHSRSIPVDRSIVAGPVEFSSSIVDMNRNLPDVVSRNV